MTQEIHIPVEMPVDPYAIVLGSGLLTSSSGFPGSAPTIGTSVPLCVITDTTVEGLYGDLIDDWLVGRGGGTVAVAPGEASKSLTVLETVLDRMVELEVRRDWTVFCFGGGVVGDLGGLAAALYMRGLPVVQIPTSLIAQVDSAVGGKTAVNLSAGKNLAGVFLQPRGVWVDPDLLDTLPDADYTSGLGEVLKYAILCGEPFFSRLEEIAPEIRERRLPIPIDVLEQCLRVKAGIVARDERETGERTFLNFGHTIGHALEHASARGGLPLSHGQAVALGILAELELGAVLEVTPAALIERTERLATRLGLETQFPGLEPADIMRFSRNDKKRRRSTGLPCVVVEDLGRMSLKADLSEAVFIEAISRRRAT